jgi:hypothetical protein
MTAETHRTSTASTPGPYVSLIEHAAGIIAPYQLAGALWEAGMLVPPGTAYSGADAPYSDALYSDEELTYAKERYAADQPDGPPWEQADPRITGRYLDRASAWHLAGLRAELADAPPPFRRRVLAGFVRRLSRGRR